MKGFRWVLLVALWAGLSAVVGYSQFRLRKDAGASAQPAAAAGDPVALTADRVLCRSGATGTKDCPVPLSIDNIPTLDASHLPIVTEAKGGFGANVSGLGTGFLRRAGASTYSASAIVVADIASALVAGGNPITGTVLTASTRIDSPSIGTSSSAQHTLPSGTAALVAADDVHLLPAPSGAGGTVYDNGSAWVRLAAGTMNYVYQSNGAGAPSWVTSLSGISLGGTYTLGGTPTLGASVTTTDNTYNFGDSTHRLARLWTVRIGGGSTSTNGHAVPNVADDTFALLSATQTLTNKSIDAGQLTGSILDARLSANVDLLNTAQSITARKTFPSAGASAAQIPAILGGASNTNGHVVPNAADDTFALLAASQTLTNKTYSAPVLSGSVTGTYTLAGTLTLGASVTTTDNTYNFGDSTHRLAQLAVIALLSGASTMTLTSNVVDGASAFAFKHYNTTALANATARLDSWGSNAVEKAAILASGGVLAPTVGPSATQQHTLPAVTSDTVALLAASQTFTNKTLTSPTLSGTVAGTYTLGGTPSVPASGLTGQVLVANGGTGGTDGSALPKVFAAWTCAHASSVPSNTGGAYFQWGGGAASGGTVNAVGNIPAGSKIYRLQAMQQTACGVGQSATYSIQTATDLDGAYSNVSGFSGAACTISGSSTKTCTVTGSASIASLSGFNVIATTSATCSPGEVVVCIQYGV